MLVFLKISWGRIPPDPPAGVGFSACVPFYIVQLWFHHLIKPFLKAYFSSVKGYKGYMHCTSLLLILYAQKRIYYSTIFCWIDLSASKCWVAMYWPSKKWVPRPDQLRTTGLDLVLAYDLIGWRFRRSLNIAQRLKRAMRATRAKRNDAPTMQFGKVWRHPIQSEWAEVLKLQRTPPCGRAVTLLAASSVFTILILNFFVSLL